MVAACAGAHFLMHETNLLLTSVYNKKWQRCGNVDRVWHEVRASLDD